MGKQKKQTIGFRYFFGIHMGVFRAADELLEIKVGDRTAWKYDPAAPDLPSDASFEALDAWHTAVNNGDFAPYPPDAAIPAYLFEQNDFISWNTPVTANQTIRIKAANLFGGEESEGGVDGTCDVMFGAPDQPVNSRLAAMVGGLVPAYRGRFMLFFDGMVSAMSKYPKPWAFRARRISTGWDGGVWYPTKAEISLASGTIKAMNPAHILYECMTNRDWGYGRARARLDDAAFKAAADTLYSEGFGLCIKWTQQSKISDFLQIIQDHAGANLYQDRLTGLWTIDLVRDGYDVNALPLFTADSGLITIDADENTALVISTNELIVSYTRPLDGSTGQVRVQNSAAIQSTGNIISESVDYLGLPTPELALRVAQRDLRAKFGVKRFKITLDRRGYKIAPGGLFRISAPERGITNLVLRAGQVEDGELSSGTITISAAMDVFGLPAASFVAVQPSLYTAPSLLPLPSPTRLINEATYRDLAAALNSTTLTNITPGTNFLTAFAQLPTSLALGLSLDTRVGTGAWLSTPGDFVPSAVLATAIGIGAEPVSITFTGSDELSQIEIGSAAQIDNEIFRVVGLDATAKTATLARGCIDTVPTAHALSATIWFYDNYEAVDQTEYAAGVTVQARVITKTGSGILSAALAPVDTYTMAQRRERPYAPGNVLINGVAYNPVINGALELSWSHRDRVMQADQLIDQTIESMGPEANVSYNVKITGEAGVIYNENTTDTSVTVDDTNLSGLFDNATTRDIRAVGVEAVSSAMSTYLSTANFVRVEGGYLTTDRNDGTSITKISYITDASVTYDRTIDLNAVQFSDDFSLKADVPQFDPYWAASNITHNDGVAYIGWATYWENYSPDPMSPDYPANRNKKTRSLLPLRDRRTDPKYIVSQVSAMSRLQFSAQYYNDTKSIGSVRTGFLITNKAAVVANTAPSIYVEHDHFYYSTATMLDSISGASDTDFVYPDFLTSYQVYPPVANNGKYGVIPNTGIIFGGLMYMHFHRGKSVFNSAGKAVAVTGVLNAHIDIATDSEFCTRVFSIDATTGATTILSTRVGLYLADTLNSTQGIEINVAAKTVNIVNNTTGILGATLATLSYTVVTTHIDVTNGFIYILGADGGFRKYDAAMALLATISIPTQIINRHSPIEPSTLSAGYSQPIVESANYLYVAGYRITKALDQAIVIPGFSQPYPGYASLSSNILMLYPQTQNPTYKSNLADEMGTASAVFNQAQSRPSDYATIELEATRLGLTSYQKHIITTNRTGWGLRWGESWGV